MKINLETYSQFQHAPDFTAYVPEKRHKPLRGELKDRNEKVYGLGKRSLKRVIKTIYG